MARYDHLQLVRLPERLLRRRQGGGRPPNRNVAEHSARIGGELAQAIQAQQRRRRVEFVDPSLILRVRMSGALLEDDWNQLGLTVLSSDEDRTLVLFSSTDDLAQFRERLTAYAHGTPPGQRQPSYNAFIGGIESIGTVEPFTRIGPGIRGAIKPDLVDIGGTLIYDPVVRRLRGGEDLAEAGVLSLHNRPVDRLFSAGSGTSYSAPLVAFKAAQILTRFPNASANLIRALLAIGATVPLAAKARLQPLGSEAEHAICGHGQTDLERAAFSDDARVVLHAEDELEIDHFAVYQVPIPEDFQTERGRRTIRVSLAYDPPVRHTRRDYAGNSMGFRLIRGREPDFILEHFRRRVVSEEGRFPEMEGRFNCDLAPSPTLREKSSLQLATATFERDVSRYGNTYHLVVRCSGGWAGDVGRQRFAVVLEIAHEADIQLYERLRQRVRVQI